MRLPLLLSSLLFFSALAEGQEVRVAGSRALVLPFTKAEPALQRQDVDLTVIGDSNTPTAIAGVATGLCEMAISTRPLLATERATYPDRPLPETIIGYQALVFSASHDVWSAGVKSLSKTEIMRIYEGRIKNWKQLGGPDREIKFFAPEQGKGIWEFFAGWMYGDMRKAPPAASTETVATPEEARNMVEFTGGSLAILPPVRADTPGVHGLALREENGKLIEGTIENVRNGTYPIARPVIAVTAFRPVGKLKKVLDYLLSTPGQEIMRRSDMVPATDAKTE